MNSDPLPISPRIPLKILGVSGSMRAEAHSLMVLRQTLKTAESHGASVRLLDLAIADLPMFRPRAKPESIGLKQAFEDVEWADAFILATPDYHGSMSGAMKNFLDYHWKQLAGKLFGYLCASHEKGLLPMEQMRTAVRQCYGWSLPYGVAINGDEDTRDANITSETVKNRVAMLARDMTVYGTLIRDQFRADLLSNDTGTFAARYR